MLAYIFYPLYQKVLQKVRKKELAAILICLFVLLILVVPAVFFVKTLVQESYGLFILVKQKLAVGFFSSCNNSFCEMIDSLGNNVEIQYRVQQITKSLTNWIIGRGSDFLVSIPIIIINLFIMTFTLYYFLKDGDVFVRKLSNYLSMKEKGYSLIVNRLKEIVQGVVFGYLLIALIQGLLGALGFFIFGISSPLFWGLAMAFLALIPYLGTGIIWVPAALILFLEGYFQGSNALMFKGIGLFIYSLIFVATLDNLIRPVFIGGKAKIHPAVIMVGIFGGIFFFGPLGIIIGPLVLSLTTVIIDSFLPEKVS